MNVEDDLRAELQKIVRLAACPTDLTDNVKSAIARAAARLGLSYRRARSLWYADPNVAVRASEADRLRKHQVRLLREHRLQLLAQADSIARILGEHPDGG